MGWNYLCIPSFHHHGCWSLRMISDFTPHFTGMWILIHARSKAHACKRGPLWTWEWPMGCRCLFPWHHQVISRQCIYYVHLADPKLPWQWIPFMFLCLFDVEKWGKIGMYVWVWSMALDGAGCLSYSPLQWPILLTWFNFNPSMDK